MWNSIITNWTTSLPAILIAICTTVGLSDVLPADWYKYLMAFCGFMTTAGFLAAKSANVSNAMHPVAAKAVHSDAVMKE